MDAATLMVTARRRNGLTQAQMAARAGTSQPVISAYEHGARDPSLGTLRRLLAGAGERLDLRLVDRPNELSPLGSPRAHGEALVDVLLLADAIPVRRPPAARSVFPRLDSTPGRRRRS